MLHSYISSVPVDVQVECDTVKSTVPFLWMGLEYTMIGALSCMVLKTSHLVTTFATTDVRLHFCVCVSMWRCVLGNVGVKSRHE